MELKEDEVEDEVWDRSSEEYFPAMKIGFPDRTYISWKG